MELLQTEIEELALSENKYVCVYKDVDNIVDELGYKGEQKYLMRDIIVSVENSMLEAFKDNHCIAIPTIGRIMKDIGKIELKHRKEEIDTIAENKGKYEAYLKTVEIRKKMFDSKREALKKDEFSEYKKKHIKRWLKIAAKYNDVYANIYFKVRMVGQLVPFDQELQDVYEKFND